MSVFSLLFQLGRLKNLHFVALTPHLTEYTLLWPTQKLKFCLTDIFLCCLGGATYANAISKSSASPLREEILFASSCWQNLSETHWSSRPLPHYHPLKSHSLIWVIIISMSSAISVNQPIVLPFFDEIICSSPVWCLNEENNYPTL